MKFTIVLILLYALGQALLVGIAVAIGFLLHWLIPGVDIGVGILVGLISTIASAYLFLQMLRLSHWASEILEAEQDDEEDDEEDDDDSFPESHFVAKAPPARGRRSGKRR